MTCIKFYTGFSGKLTSITDLYNRIAYLYKAEEHLKAYQETKAAKPATDLRTHLAARLGASGHEEGLAVMALTTEEIVRHISSIKLQVEVTEYLYKCFTKRGNLTWLKSPDYNVDAKCISFAWKTIPCVMYHCVPNTIHF